MHKTAPGTSLSKSESNRRTAQPARRPEGQAASENFCGHTPPSLFYYAHAPCHLHDWGVRTRFDLTRVIVRVAPFRHRSALFHQQLCRHRDIAMAKQHIESTYVIFPKSTSIVLLRSSAPLSQLVLHALGDRGGLCVAQHGLYNWKKPGLRSFLCAE